MIKVSWPQIKMLIVHGFFIGLEVALSWFYYFSTIDRLAEIGGSANMIMDILTMVSEITFALIIPVVVIGFFHLLVVGKLRMYIKSAFLLLAIYAVGLLLAAVIPQLFFLLPLIPIPSFNLFVFMEEDKG